MPPFDDRYLGKLEGILGSVRATFGKQFLNKHVIDASAAYFNQFVRGHAFRNGNKRMAVLFTHFFLLKNGIDFTLSPDELYNLAVGVALQSESGESFEATKSMVRDVISKFTVEWKPGKYV